MSLNINQCGFNLQDVLHLLAGALIKDSATDTVKLRVKLTVETCAEIEQIPTCETSYLPPEELLKQIFEVEDCGNLIVNISVPEIPS